MKKQFAIAALTVGAIVLGTNNVQAQVLSKKAETVVAIDLADLLSIEAGEGANAVTFEYKTAEAYNTSQSHEVKNSLKISSSKQFDVKVHAAGEFFTGPEGTIPVKVLDITATGDMDGTIKLSEKEQLLVNGADKGLYKSLNINYSISADNAKDVLLGTTAGNYTQTVIYTVTH